MKKSKKYSLIGGAAVSMLAIVLVTNIGQRQYLTGGNQRALKRHSSATKRNQCRALFPYNNRLLKSYADPETAQLQVQQESLVQSRTMNPAMASSMYNPALDDIPHVQSQSGDKFQKVNENAVKSTADNPVSTFSIDVDTSSYAVVRRSLNNGRLAAERCRAGGRNDQLF